MSTLKASIASRRRGDRNNWEFQSQIGLTRFAENDTASVQEKIVFRIKKYRWEEREGNIRRLSMIERVTK